MDPTHLSDLYVAYKTGPNAHITPVDKFWSLVERKDGCWDWTGKKDSSGRGTFELRGKSHMAYRLSFVLEKGPIPEGMLVCHHCDNPGCVNPEHLFVGTHNDNMQDMVNKGRGSSSRGEKSGKAKLSWNLVFEMRRDRRLGTSMKELAEKYKISQKQVSVIVNEKQWVLDFDTYQQLCLERCIYPNHGSNVIYTVLGLLGESGEIAEKIKKIIRDDRVSDLSTISEEKRALLAAELGDVLFYIAATAFELGVPLAEIATGNVNKLASRAARGVLKGSGDDR